MNTAHDRHTGSQRGFSLIEVLVAMMITMIVMASVMLLLQKGQTTFQREPEVAEMNQNARYGLDMISRDLTMAGLNTPATMAIMWVDGGGNTPDELTIVYADPDVPTSVPQCPGNAGGNSSLTPTDPPVRFADLSKVLRNRPAGPNLWRNPFALHVSASFLPAFFGAGGGGGGGGGNSGGGGGGPCGQVANASIVEVSPSSFKPPVGLGTDGFPDADAAAGSYKDGQVLFALSTCDPPGLVPFELTKAPWTTGSGENVVVKLQHNPGQGGSGFNPPGGFNGQVIPGCAVFGLFRVIQYRINPLPPAANPRLERRDLSDTFAPGVWTPVANNIENLQVQFALGTTNNFVDNPAVPISGDPDTWITQVSVEIDATSETENLQGASQGVFADGNRLRRTFTTTVNLRNQLNQMTVANFEAGGLGSAEDYN